MKYFDILPASVEDELIKRGVSVNRLLYCAKADMDGDGCYLDMYLAFDSEALYILRGYEIYERLTKSRKKAKQLCRYKTEGFEEILIDTIDMMYVDRYQNTARLMIQDNKEGEKKEYPIARFSIGYAEKFENFAARVNQTHNKETIDDTLLEGIKTHCPICGNPYPDPNRPICPYCVDKHSVFRRLMGMFKEFKGAIVSILICIGLSGGFSILAPYFGTKMLYDDVLAEGGKYYGRILMIVLLMAAINLIGKLLNMISGLILANVVPTVTHRLRCKIFTAMQTLSLPFFTSKQTGSLMTRVDNDSENIYWFFVDIVPYGLMNFAKIIGIAAIMFMLSPLLSIGIFAIIIVIEVVQSRFYKTQRKLYRKLHIATRAGTAVLSDALNGERVVKAFAKEDQETKRYDEKNNEMFRIDSAINNRIADTVPTLWMFCRLVSYLLGIVGVLLIIDGKLEFGVLTALLSYTNMIYDPINFFTWIGNRFANCIDAASRMFEILDSTPTVKESDHPIHIDSMKGDIKLKNVSFEYEAGRPIIKDVSFQVEAGQMFGIVGKTGAGKSTIINLIARLYDVTGGEILIDGIPVKNIAVKDLRKNIGIVSQETYLFMGSIADNIRYARPEATMEEVISAAKAAYAHEFITKLPDGYNTRIGSGAVNLSGGERQRISIARAIIQKPNILILDEATASMDTRTERKIQVAISELKKGRTIISIAHRLSTLRDADMLCVIENGELKEMGTHDELIHKKGKYFDLYRLQADALKFIGFDEDKLMNTYQIAEYDEIFCEELVGCSMLVGRKGKKYRFFCAFTQTYFIRYAEVCKLIEHYKRTGEWITDTKEEEPICPKCGLPFDGATVCPYCAKKSDYLLRLIKRTAPYKGYFVAALICTIITELIWVIMPYLQRIMIDDYVTTGRKADSKLAFLGIATIGLVLVAWILEHINMKASCKVALSVGRDLRSDIFAKTQQMSMASVSKRTAGELINRIRRDAMRLQDFITANGKDAIVKLFSLIILGIMLFVMNYKLALLVILPVPAVVFCVSKLFHVMSIRYGRGR